MTLDEARELLSLPRGASQAAVRDAFRATARTVHPDRHPGANAEEHRRLAQQFDRARQARDVLLLVSPEEPQAPAPFSERPTSHDTRTATHPSTRPGTTTTGPARRSTPTAPQTRREARDHGARRAATPPASTPTLRFDEFVAARDAEGFGVGPRTRRYRDVPRIIAWSIVAGATAMVVGGGVALAVGLT
jgi:hypothetical protein